MAGGLFGLINRLLPFATPGTPLIQDVLHLAALCTVLYYAPQIQAYIQTRRDKDEEEEDETATAASGVGDEQQQQQQQQQQNEQVQEGQNQDPQPRIREQYHPPAAFVEDASSSSDEDDNDSDNEDNIPLAHQFGVPAAAAADGDPGPANINPAPEGNGAARRTTSTRTVGAKKAKSLARKDQRRAYHEFQRSQGEAQRAREAEGAREREAQVAAERARRAAQEAIVEAKRAKEREEKRAKEMKAQKDELERRERAIAIVRAEVFGEEGRGVCDLEGVAGKIGGGADRTWVEGLVRASGLLGVARDDARITILTETGWVVRVSREDMEHVYARVLESGVSDEQGKIPHDRLASALEEVCARRAVSSA